MQNPRWYPPGILTTLLGRSSALSIEGFFSQTDELPTGVVTTPISWTRAQGTHPLSWRYSGSCFCQACRVLPKNGAERREDNIAENEHWRDRLILR
jgi:hypothetical protein